MADTGLEFRQQVAALLPRLRRFSLSLTGTVHDADDLVQSAVVRALANADQWRPDTRLDSWMYRIVQNLWIDETRRHKRAPKAVIDEAMELTGEDGRETTERRLMLAAARRAFDDLAPELRSAAALVMLNGMSYREAADTLDVPIGTIMSRVSRARRALEAALGQGERG